MADSPSATAILEVKLKQPALEKRLFEWLNRNVEETAKWTKISNKVADAQRTIGRRAWIFPALYATIGLSLALVLMLLWDRSWEDFGKAAAAVMALFAAFLLFHDPKEVTIKSFEMTDILGKPMPAAILEEINADLELTAETTENWLKLVGAVIGPGFTPSHSVLMEGVGKSAFC